MRSANGPETLDADPVVREFLKKDARKYVPGVLTSRGEDPEVGLAVLEQIRALVTPVDRALYQHLEEFARRRVATRDEEDWPVVAVAFLLDVPIWTEDQDFFGSGIATWTGSCRAVFPTRRAAILEVNRVGLAIRQ